MRDRLKQPEWRRQGPIGEPGIGAKQSGGSTKQRQPQAKQEHVVDQQQWQRQKQHLGLRQGITQPPSLHADNQQIDLRGERQSSQPDDQIGDRHYEQNHERQTNQQQVQWNWQQQRAQACAAEEDNSWGSQQHHHRGSRWKDDQDEAWKYDARVSEDRRAATSTTAGDGWDASSREHSGWTSYYHYPSNADNNHAGWNQRNCGHDHWWSEYSWTSSARAEEQHLEVQGGSPHIEGGGGQYREQESWRRHLKLREEQHQTDKHAHREQSQRQQQQEQRQRQRAQAPSAPGAAAVPTETLHERFVGPGKSTQSELSSKSKCNECERGRPLKLYIDEDDGNMYCSKCWVAFYSVEPPEK